MHTYLLCTLLSLNIIASGVYLLYKIMLALAKDRVGQRFRYMGCIAVMLLFLIPFYQLLPPPASVSTGSINSGDTVGSINTAAVKENTDCSSDEIGCTSFFSISCRTQKAIIRIWFYGMLILTMWYLFAFCRFRRRLLHNGSKTASADLQRVADMSARECGLTRMPVLKVLPDIQGPMLIGFFKPVIALAYDEISLSDAALILKHELVHFKRRDLWWKLLAVILQCVHWFNPVVWILGREFEFCAETSCDAEVVKDLDYDGRKRYGHLLISYVQLQHNFNRSAGISFSPAHNKMKARISIMLNGNKSKKVIATAIVCVLAAGCFTMSAFAAQNQKNVPSPIDGVVTDKNGQSARLDKLFSGEITKDIPFAETINPEDGWNVNVKGSESSGTFDPSQQNLPPLNIPDEFKEAVMRGEVEPFQPDDNVTVFSAD